MSVELLSQGQLVRFRPSGNSMHPTIKDGEAITVAPVNASDIKRGDILLYVTGRGVTAHRVSKINNFSTSFILRGDATGSSDEAVEFDQILGRVISVERDGRSINLTSRRAKMMRRARAGASRIKSRVSSARNS